jgi:hypothetical protein
MPKNASTFRNKTISTLTKDQHNLIKSSKEFVNKVDTSKLNSIELVNYQEIIKKYYHEVLFDEDFIKRQTLITSKCENEWREQRNNNDWINFSKNFKEVVEIAKEKASIIFKANPNKYKTLYDTLLDYNEPELTSDKVDDVFNNIKSWLPTMIKEAKNKQVKRQNKPILKNTQKKICLEIMKLLGFDFNCGRLDTSKHPFCTNISNDVRITTNKSTTLSANVYSYSTEITVVDGSVFQTPRPGDPGIIWVGTERILYDRLDGNVISQLTRGSAGTSIQDHLIIDIYGNPVTVDVIEGSEEETFNRLDTNRAIWLEVGSQFYTYQSYAGSNVAYVAPNQLSIVTTATAIEMLNAGGVVSMSANGTMLTANGTHYSTSYTSNVTFFYITDIDNANLTITVEDDLFLQDGLWDYYGFDSEEYDDDISEFINGNTTITLEIPTLNTGSNSALSLADVANADYANVESLMKFIHGI